MSLAWLGNMRGIALAALLFSILGSNARVVQTQTPSGNNPGNQSGTSSLASSKDRPGDEGEPASKAKHKKKAKSSKTATSNAEGKQRQKKDSNSQKKEDKEGDTDSGKGEKTKVEEPRGSSDNQPGTQGGSASIKVGGVGTAEDKQKKDKNHPCVTISGDVRITGQASVGCAEEDKKKESEKTPQDKDRSQEKNH